MIKFLDYSKLYTSYPVDDAMKRALVGGKLILQSDVEEFERRFAKFLGVKHVVALASGTDALLMALIASGVGKGDEVISSAHTFKSTIGVIRQVGATQIIVDIDENGLMNLEQVREGISSKTKAIIPVQLTGDIVDMDKLKLIAKSIPIIEDSCQAVGAEWNKQKAGTFGIVGCFSFYPAKILGCYGDGGAVATNDVVMANEIRDMRNHYKGSNKDFGVNSRLDNLQAAVLNVKLDYLETDIKKRAAIAKNYDDGLYDLPIKIPRQRKGRVYQDYVIRTNQRDNLYNWLDSQGIETLKNEYIFTTCYKKGVECEKYEEETLRIPCNPYMTSKEVQYVIQCIREYYDKRN